MKLKKSKSHTKFKLNPKFKPLTLDNDWPWRPYRGYAVWAIIDQNPKYVSWAVEKGIQLDNEAFQKLQDTLDNE